MILSFQTEVREMAKSVNSLLIKKMNQLPPDLLEEVNDFVDVLLKEKNVSASIEEYEEAIKEIKFHKEGKIKLLTLEEMLSEI